MRPNSKLLQLLQSNLRFRHSSPRTVEVYTAWTRRYVRYHRMRHPVEMGEPEIRSFLVYLAEERQPVDGRDRAVEMSPLVEAGNVLGGMSAGFLAGFDKASGKVVWQVPGDYHFSHPSLAIAGNILNFQGSPKAKPAAVSRGTLYALDLETPDHPLVVQSAHRRTELGVRLGDTS